MKVGLYADPHLTQSSSIIIGKSGSFTGRLENIIKSCQWMNETFKKYNTEINICLGDMTDKPTLTAEEITALSQCGLEDHYFIVGNHCRSTKAGDMNSLSMFSNIIYKPGFLEINGKQTNIYILPYTSDEIQLPEADIILSHNDIKNFDFGGGHPSEYGFSIEDALDKCKLLVNGHIHSGSWLVNDRILNLGQLSGMNFASCNTQWNPSIAILDTDTCTIDLVENPYAYIFKKETFNKLTKLKKYIDSLDKNNYVIQVKVPAAIAAEARQLLDQSAKVVASRVLTINETKVNKEKIEEELNLQEKNIYEQFRVFIMSRENNNTYDKEILNALITKINQEEKDEHTV